MTFLQQRFNKKTNKTYVYEITSKWDPVKKRSFPIQKYVGILDSETKKISKKYSKPENKLEHKRSRNFGTIYFLKSIAQKINLISSLKESLPNIWESILELAIFKIISGHNFYLYEAWAEDNLINKSLSSQRISELLEKIDEENFFDVWFAKNKTDKALFFDITSISSYSEDIGIAEFGYNRDSESLRQINFGIISDTDKLPLAYRIYPGSVPDVATISKLIPRTLDWKINNIIYIFDCAFSRRNNLDLLGENKVEYITRLDPSLKLNKQLLSSFTDDIGTSFEFNKDIFHYNQVTEKVGKYEQNIFIYKSEAKKLLEEIHFFKVISRVEEVTKNLDEKSIKQIIEQEKVGEYFTVTDKKLIRVTEKIKEAVSNFGKFILITNIKVLTAREILYHYRDKDTVEKMFDNFKIEIGHYRLRTHKDLTTKGSIFISFVALIIYQHIVKKLNRHKKFNIQKILLHLSTIKINSMSDGSLYLTEITAKNREIFNHFGMEIPSEPRIQLAGI